MPQIVVDNIEWVFSGIGLVIFGIISSLFSRIWSWWDRRRTIRTLLDSVGADLYPRNVIEQATANFVKPDFVNVDPDESHEPALMVAAREDIFKKLDYVLSHQTEHKYFFIFGGSGTGKTTLLLNYFAKFVRRNERGTKMLLVPVGHHDADERIKKFPKKRNTTLLLDAFDEDENAIIDYQERLQELVELTDEYSKVVITCRTQFFPKDSRIPEHAGVIRGPRAAGRHAQHSFYRLYIAPFNNRQIRTYIRRRYPLFYQKQRKQAKAFVSRIPYLAVRPMLLAHIDDLVMERKNITYSFELYNVMAEAWLKREEGVHEEIQAAPIMEFCQRLGVESFSRMRKSRDYQRFSPDQLKELGKEWELDISGWQLTGRSLLNRDGNGYYKFAHSSIMEFFVVEAFTRGNWKLVTQPWTRQMIRFLQERIEKFAKKISENNLSIPRDRFIPPWIQHILTPRSQTSVHEDYRDHKSEVIWAIFQGATNGGLKGWLSYSDNILHDRLTNRSWWVGSGIMHERDSRNQILKSIPKHSG